MKLNKVLVSAAALSGIAAAGTAANADTVSVKAGDTVSELAQKFNTTVEAIQKANNLKNVNFITVGEQLNIPANDNTQQQVQQPQANAVQVQQEQASQQAAIAQQQAAQRQAQLAAQQKTAQAQAALQAQQAAQKAQQEAAAAQAQAAAVQTAKEQQEKAEQAAKEQQEKAAQQAAANAKAAQQRAAQQAQAQQNTQQQAVNNNQQSNNNNNNSNSSEAAAKAWIVAHESGGNYNAHNGQYIGAYQLSASYLHGDYSQANQDRVANQYVASRYGNWVNAQKHWEQCGWY